MEDTNIPDQLTYHEPEPYKRTEPKDKLYRTAQIISAIFTPFPASVRGIRLAFHIHLPAHPAPPVQIDCTRHRVLLHHPPAHAQHLPDAENQRLDASRVGQARTAFRSLSAYDIKLRRMHFHDVPLSPSPLYGRHHHRNPALHGHLRTYQHQMENQYPYGKQRHDGRRIAFIQLHLPVQPDKLALRFYPARRHVGFSTHHRPPTYLK